MNGEAAASERRSFSQRLKQALTNAGYVCSPTQVARQFNLRFDGKPITQHAVRKWLLGESIPTQEKLTAIAVWLGVPVAWLRYGGAERIVSAREQMQPVSAETERMLRDLQRLDSTQRRLVGELISQLSRQRAE